MGTMVDSGAARSCIGIKEAKALAKIQVADQEVLKSKIYFKFRDIVHKSLGKMRVLVPSPHEVVCHLHVTSVESIFHFS